MFSGVSHWWCLGSLKRTQHSIIASSCAFQHWRWIYTHEHEFVFYDEDSPNPTLSYCACSRSMVCLMTASLALWRRPCRPLMPFISSICSSSESNLRRYLHKHKAHATLVKYTQITQELLIFAWKKKQKQHKCQRLPFNDFTGIFSAVNGLFWIQVALKPQQLFTWKSDKKQKGTCLVERFDPSMQAVYNDKHKNHMSLPMLLRCLALSVFCLQKKKVNESSPSPNKWETLCFVLSS